MPLKCDCRIYSLSLLSFISIYLTISSETTSPFHPLSKSSEKICVSPTAAAPDVLFPQLSPNLCMNLKT